jgi:Asp-tRNA(Asn)/Glu-tRNA(Gln) amidotransferase A subunit family amidase
LKSLFINKGKTHPDCIKAVKDAVDLCIKLGHEVEEASPKIDVEQFTKAFNLVVGGHTAAMLDRISKLKGIKITEDMVEPFTWRFAQVGWKNTAADFAGTKAIINSTTRSVAQFFTKYNAILTPTLGTPPPKLGYLDTVKLSFDDVMQRLNEFMPFTPLFNMTGLPAMSVPLHWNDEGLPIGVQFAFPYADESTLYRLASQLEAERPWKNNLPKMAQL